MSAPSEGSDRESSRDLGPDRSAVLTAALAEFGKLRDEIAGRSTTLWTLLSLSATVSSAVAGFVLSSKADPRLLLLLPLVTPALGLLVIDHATNIGNIGEYIAKVIKPLVREVTRDDRLFGYEDWVDDWETRPVRRTLAFGVPLVLLFTVVPVYALGYTFDRLDTAWLWGLWVIGVLLTSFQVAMWMVFLVPPLRRLGTSSEPAATSDR